MDDTKVKQKVNIHSGHRNRLKDKARKFGFKTFQDHEVLEMLLTYTIPRKNTNPLAHNLLQEFGNMQNVLDASYSDLIKIDGVGKETALFLNCLSNIFERCVACKKDVKNEYIKSTHDLVVYFRKHNTIKNYEEMIIVCTNKNGKVIKTHKFEGEDLTTVKFTTKEFAEHIISKDVAYVAIVHTHPSGECKPTVEDISATDLLFQTCVTFGIVLIDHLIVNEDSHYSFRTARVLEKFENEYKRTHNQAEYGKYFKLMQELDEEN